MITLPPVLSVIRSNIFCSFWDIGAEPGVLLEKLSSIGSSAGAGVLGAGVLGVGVPGAGVPGVGVLGTGVLGVGELGTGSGSGLEQAPSNKAPINKKNNDTKIYFFITFSFSFGNTDDKQCLFLKN